MRPKYISVTLVALDRNGLATDDMSGGAGNFTLDGALTSGGIYTADVPRHIGIYSANDDSGDTFTVTGTDRYGNALTETITGPNNATSSGTYNFATVTQVSVGSATVGNVEVGTLNSCETAWVPVPYRISSPYQVSITYSNASTMTAQVQYTLEDPFSNSFNEHTCRKFTGIPEKPCRAIRMRVTDFTDGTATLTIICPR